MNILSKILYGKIDVFSHSGSLATGEGGGRGRYWYVLLVLALVFSACQSDDTDFSAFTEEKPAQSTDCTIYIAYNGNSVTVTGDDNGLVTANGAHVTVNATSHADSLLLVLSGNSDNGSLLVYRQ